MTGCLNRKAYDEDISEIRMDSQFIYVSMDVNGLRSSMTDKDMQREMN